MSNCSTAVKSLFDSWLSPKLLAAAEPAFSEAAIRNLIFNADDRHSSKGIILGNGLGPHIRRVGSKVLINHGGFLSWIDGGTDGLNPLPYRSNKNWTSKPGKCPDSPTIALKVRETEPAPVISNAEPFDPEAKKVRLEPSSNERSRSRI